MNEYLFGLVSLTLLTAVVSQIFSDMFDIGMSGAKKRLASFGIMYGLAMLFFGLIMMSGVFISAGVVISAGSFWFVGANDGKLR